MVDVGQDPGAALVAEIANIAQNLALQNMSRPSSICRVRTGATSKTTAPASSKRFAAASTASRISVSAARPQPASSITPIFMPRTSISWSIQSKSLGGRLVPSRQSGRESVAIEKAASSTHRVIGPAQRPT